MSRIGTQRFARVAKVADIDFPFLRPRPLRVVYRRCVQRRKKSLPTDTPPSSFCLFSGPPRPPPYRPRAITLPRNPSLSAVVRLQTLRLTVTPSAILTLAFRAFGIFSVNGHVGIIYLRAGRVSQALF